VTESPAVRSYGKGNNHTIKEEPQLLKRLKPQKRLKLFCHTTTIRAIFHGHYSNPNSVQEFSLRKEV